MYSQIALSPVAKELSELRIKTQNVKGAALVLQEVENSQCLQFMFWSEQDESFLDSLVLEDGYIMHLSPQTYQLINFSTQQMFDLNSLPADKGVVSDLSHARSIFRLSGIKAHEFLQSRFAIDINDQAFKVGMSLQTSVSHMGVSCHRVDEDMFDLFVFRGFAGSFLDWISHEGALYGFQIA